MTSKLHIFSLCLIILLSLNSHSLADDNKRSPLDIASEREVTIIKDHYGGEYVNPTLQNLSRLYWRLGVFDLLDDFAIDNYLKINECDIFTSYYKDEFEWIEIRDATRKSIGKQRDTYENKFKFVLPIILGNYDQDRGGFDLIRNTGFPNLKRIEFVDPNRKDEVCYLYPDIPDYERNVLLILDQPLDYTFVEMDDHVAQAFILRKKYEYMQIDEAVRLRRYERQAYIRLRMTIKEYQGSIKGQTLDGNLAILYGRLDGIDIFDDYEQKLLLASYDINELNEMKAVVSD